MFLALSQGFASFHINFQVQIYSSLHSSAFTGYVLIVGFLSFAVCYKHGPLVEERSINLLTWTLQLLSLFLIYSGVSMPQIAYVVMILILLSRSLYYPMKAFHSMRWYVSFFFSYKFDILNSGFIYCVWVNFFGHI